MKSRKWDILKRLRDCRENDFHNADTLKQIKAEIEWLEGLKEVCRMCQSIPCSSNCASHRLIRKNER